MLIRRLVGLVEKDRGLVLSVCLWTQFYRLVKSSTGNTQQMYFFLSYFSFFFYFFCNEKNILSIKMSSGGLFTLD